jgi:hypothetical protein
MAMDKLSTEDTMPEKKTIEDILVQPRAVEDLDIPQSILIDILSFM